MKNYMKKILLLSTVVSVAANAEVTKNDTNEYCLGQTKVCVLSHKNSCEDVYDKCMVKNGKVESHVYFEEDFKVCGFVNGFYVNVNGEVPCIMPNIIDVK
jgi:hypothetical protein